MNKECFIKDLDIKMKKLNASLICSGEVFFKTFPMKSLLDYNIETFSKWSKNQIFNFWKYVKKDIPIPNYISIKRGEVKAEINSIIKKYFLQIIEKILIMFDSVEDEKENIELNLDDYHCTIEGSTKIKLMINSSKNETCSIQFLYFIFDNNEEASSFFTKMLI